MPMPSLHLAATTVENSTQVNNDAYVRVELWRSANQGDVSASSNTSVTKPGQKASTKAAITHSNYPEQAFFKTMPWALEPAAAVHESAAPMCGPDPLLQGRKVLLILTGKRTRWRVLRSMVQSGVQLIIYNPERNWAAEFIAHDAWILGPFGDWAEALRLVCECPAVFEDGQTQLDAVMSYDEFGVELAAHLAERLGLPCGTPSRILAQLRNKFNFRTNCRQHGLPAPNFMLLTTSFDAAAKARFESLDIGLPVVVKPAKGAGSCHVCKVDSYKDLEACVETYRTMLPSIIRDWGLTGPEDPGCGLLLESFMPGEEVDIDCIVHAGRLQFVSISDNFAPPAGTLMESGGRCPSALPAAAQEGLLRLIHGLVEMCGPDVSGVFHVEAMWTARGAVPIEFNTRPGGAETFTMVQTTRGVDLAREALRIALGQLRPVPAADSPLSYAHSVNFVPAYWQGEGLLKRTVLGGSLAADSALAGLELHHDEGARVVLPPAGYMYMGWLAAHGRSAKEAEEAARRLEQQVVFEFGACPPPSDAACRC